MLALVSFVHGTVLVVAVPDDASLERVCNVISVDDLSSGVACDAGQQILLRIQAEVVKMKEFARNPFSRGRLFADACANGGEVPFDPMTLIRFEDLREVVDAAEQGCDSYVCYVVLNRYAKEAASLWSAYGQARWDVSDILRRTCEHMV